MSDLWNTQITLETIDTPQEEQPETPQAEQDAVPTTAKTK